ncbi:MAG: hypothetical protein VKJ06_08345 [Vampirovibrionales bacterium]|nr:hypothetical protein [Vampirovibrionales bacterium]
MQNLLEFIKDNNQLLSFVAVSVAGAASMFKWLDTRNRELQEKRFKEYMGLISIISGRLPDGTSPAITEQVASVWFLLNYKEYKNITCKIFSHTDLDSMANEKWVAFVKPEVNALLKECS